MNIHPPLALGVACALLPWSPPLFAQADTVEIKEEIGHAEEVVVERLLRLYGSAVESKQAAEVITVLEQIIEFDNEEFFEVAKEALKYKATSEDKKTVKVEASDLGIRKPKEIAKMLAEREGDVQILAAGVLANIGGKRTGPLLHKTFRDKKLRRAKPRVAAALITAMGTVGYVKAQKDVEGEYRAYSDRDVMRAAVRFFGQTKCKSLSIARTLAGDLDPPEPMDVDAAANPPASYWATRWESWLFVRRDVAWALKEITGQHFRPSDGENPSDSTKALKYIKANAKRLGLK